MTSRSWFVASLCLLVLAPAAVLATDSGTPLPAGGPGGGPPPGRGGIPGNPLTTIFASDNSFCGNMFDLETTVDVTLTGFEVNIGDAETGAGGGSADVTVYWHPDTSFGNEGSPAGWTELGTMTVTAQGRDVPTEVPMGGLVLTGGSSYGLYVTIDEATCNSTMLMFYTNGADVYTDGTLTLTTNSGNGEPHFDPGSIFQPRIWNGTIYYVEGVPTVPGRALLLLAVLLLVVTVVALRRRGFAKRT